MFTDAGGGAQQGGFTPSWWERACGRAEGSETSSPESLFPSGTLSRPAPLNRDHQGLRLSSKSDSAHQRAFPKHLKPNNESGTCLQFVCGSFVFFQSSL